MAKAGSGVMIEVIPEYALTREDEAQVAQLLRASFPTDFGGRSFYQQRPHLRIVWRAPEILGHIALFYRAIRLDGQLTDVTGLGDIATAPQARGQGIATALLDRAPRLGLLCPNPQHSSDLCSESAALTAEEWQDECRGPSSYVSGDCSPAAQRASVA